MGRGIAEVAAQSGIATILVKATPGPLDERAALPSPSRYGRAVKKGKLHRRGARRHALRA